jgi:serine/threonine protein kinase
LNRRNYNNGGEGGEKLALDIYVAPGKEGQPFMIESFDTRTPSNRNTGTVMKKATRNVSKVAVFGDAHSYEYREERTWEGTEKGEDGEKFESFLNEYEIIRELGKGMYGVVHLAKRKVERAQGDNFCYEIQVWRRIEEEPRTSKQK